jgi:hypothetical protein
MCFLTSENEKYLSSLSAFISLFGVFATGSFTLEDYSSVRFFSIKV